MDVNKLVVAERIGKVSFAPDAARRRLPTRRVDKFAGREDELKELAERLKAKPNDPLAVHQMHGLFAGGGVGKTELAIEFAWRCWESKGPEAYPGGCYFVSAETVEPEAALATLAAATGVPALDDDIELGRRVTAAIVAFKEPSLLIIDNIPSDDAWTRWREALPGPPARLLITTREEQLADVDMMALGRLSDDASRDLLGRFRRDALEPAASAAIEKIVRWCDGWAVALALIGAYMKLNKGASWPAAWNGLDGRGLQSLREITNPKVQGEARYYQHVEVLVDQVIEQLNPCQRRLIEYASLLPEDLVPASWLADLVAGDDDIEVKPGFGYEDAVTEALQNLIDLDLLRPRQTEGKILALHRVIRRRMRELLGAAV